MHIKFPLFKGIGIAMSIFFLSVHSLFAQTTVTIGPGADWTDVELIQINKPGSEHIANTNFAVTPNIIANAWTNSGNTFKRSLLKFNLNAIPSGATIQSAILYLNSDPTVTSPSAANGNSQLSGSNAVFLEKVTSNWLENTVTWNTQPTTSVFDRLWQPASVSVTENIQVNITSFVQGWVNGPDTNFGLKMLLENEQYYRSRSYASEEHANAAIRPQLVITYAYSDPVATKMNKMFERINKAEVPTGFLADYGAAFLPLDVFNGTLTDSNRVNIDAWRMAYASLYTSKIGKGNNPLPSLPVVNNTIKELGNNNEAIPIAINFSEYAYIRSDAFEKNLLRLEEDQLVDVSERKESPYAKRYLFAATPVFEDVDAGKVTLNFRKELFYNTTDKQVQSLAIDFGDGNGYVSAQWDTPITGDYEEAGLKLIKIKVILADEGVFECYSQLKVNKTTWYDHRRHDVYHRIDPETLHSGGEVRVWYGAGHTAITKPLIVVEGFEPYTVYPALGGKIDYSDFLESIFSNNFDFSDELDLAGYDIIYLDYNNGVDDIRRNAALFEEVLTWVNSNKVAGAEQNVVLGISMGGLVARYGLAKMTKGGPPNITQTRLLITHDSPHKGANVPLGFQNIFTAVPDLTVNGIRLLDLLPELGNAVDLLNEPATEQMLILRSVNGQGVNNYFLDNVYRPMIEFGASDPEPTYNFIATSQGSECGQQLFGPHTQLAKMEGEAFIGLIPWITRHGLEMDATINALPEQGVSKRITHINLKYILKKFWILNIKVNLLNYEAYSPSYALPWDGAPGGYHLLDFTDQGENVQFGPFFKYFFRSHLIDNFTFVPTVSALDISNINSSALSASYVGGLSPNFPSKASKFIAQDRDTRNRVNIRHTRFTERNMRWMFNHMENDFSNNGVICASQCAPTVTITKPANGVCDNLTRNFTAPNLGSGVTYNWTVSSGLQIVSGQGTNQIGVRSVPQTPLTQTVNLSVITAEGCVYNAPSVNVMRGPIIGEIDGQDMLCQVPGNYYINAPGGGTVEWSLTKLGGDPAPAGLLTNMFSNPCTIVGNLQSGSSLLGYYYLSVQVTDGCGTAYTSKVVEIKPRSACNTQQPVSYQILPNPASNELTVMIEESDSEESNTSATSQQAGTFSTNNTEIKLYDKYNNVLRQGTMNNKRISFDLYNIPNGMYYLHIINGNESIRRTILVNK